MTHGSLFNGIGGLQLAAHWLGWENLFSCEIDPFCSRVTKYHFPNCVQHGDIKTSDFRLYRGSIDVLSGGFPCQPFSKAGKRQGTSDDRHLWPEMLRAIQQIRPRWVVAENVPGLLNWRKGMVFAGIKTEMEVAGFEVFPPIVFPACAVKAPHRRERVWIIAHSISHGHRDKPEQNRCSSWEIEGEENKRQRLRAEPEGISIAGTTADPDHARLQGWPYSGNIEGEGATAEQFAGRYNKLNDWGNFPTQQPIRDGDDGFPAGLDGITLSDWQQNSLMAAGNAIVPQAGYMIFDAIDRLKG